jgi:hypothetical protein
MKNQYKKDKEDKEEQQWQGWPLAPRPSDWLDRHTGFLLGCVLIAGSVFSFVCGVVIGLVQPFIYHWVLRLLGVE